jgi:hypothetical protein
MDIEESCDGDVASSEVVAGGDLSDNVVSTYNTQQVQE